MDLSKEEKFKFLKEVDLQKTEFEVKIADFGLSARRTDTIQKFN